MAHSSRLVRCFIALLVLLTGALPVQADQGKDLFDKQCAGCHSIGGGDRGGPDLKGVTKKRAADWLVRVIVEPEKLSGAKDPMRIELIKKYGYEMPNLGISHDDAKKLIAYFAVTDGAVSTTSAVSAQGKIETPVTPELVAQGKALITGSKRFANGGAPCISCHPFTYPGIVGGNLSKADLSESYKKMGETGMRGALASLKFPTMKKIYADKPLTDDEIAAMMAIFKDTPKEKGGVCPVSFPLMGGIIFVLLLLGLALYKRRIR